MTNSIHSSWVDSANGHSDFPHQNLSFGIFIPLGLPPRGGVAIGDELFDLSACANSVCSVARRCKPPG